MDAQREVFVKGAVQQGVSPKKLDQYLKLFQLLPVTVSIKPCGSLRSNCVSNGFPKGKFSCGVYGSIDDV